jgi:hypothetical protein
MKIFLLIMMFSSGTVTTIPFGSVDSCINAAQELSGKVLTRNAGYITCILDKGAE